MAMRFVPLREGYLAEVEFGQQLPRWITAWGNFDGVVFMRIAHGGYGVPEIPFFPLLPLLMRSLSWIGLPYVLGGMLISVVSFLGVIWVWQRLWQLDGQRVPFQLLFLTLLSFPTAHYFTAVYQDALFLLLASATLLWSRERRWVWAVVAAVLATLSRLNGLALFFVLGAEYLMVVSPALRERWGVRSIWQGMVQGLHPRSWWSQRYVWLFLLVPLTFLGYLGYVQWKFGDWHLFFSGVEVWHRSQLTFPLQTLWRYFKILVVHARVTFVYWVAWGEALATALYGLVLLFSWGKIRFSYWVFMLVHLSIPMVTGTLQGMPRYGLHLYPLFLLLATWLWQQRPLIRWLYFAMMLVLQVLYLLAFIQGYFVA